METFTSAPPAAAGAWDGPPGWFRHATLRADSPETTDRLARRLADATGPGDTLLLSGALGAGKSHFARAFIRHAMGPGAEGMDVPSPSFTLVQTYDAPKGEIWHADLYRLSGPDEVLELGLEEAMETARCLIEWPERLAPELPASAVIVRFESDPQDDEAARLIGLWSRPGVSGNTLKRVLDAWPKGEVP